MKGCNRLAEQARKRRFWGSYCFKDMCGGRPEAQAKDVNTVRMGRNQGEGGGRGGGAGGWAKFRSPSRLKGSPGLQKEAQRARKVLTPRW